MRVREQPVLVGTVSIEKSEIVAALLKKKRIPPGPECALHEQEAMIIAQAGAPGRSHRHQHGRPRHRHPARRQPAGPPQAGDPSDVDEATAAAAARRIEDEVQAARDIVLKGGGLYIIGTERHESRRIDNQLRGRSGRQGDPGASRFFLSLEDDLMRIFGSERMDSMLQRFGLKEGEAIVHPWVNKALEKAQQKVEARNFDIRKNILKYDNVMNNQRKVIYEQRRELMRAVDVSSTVEEMRHDVIDALVTRFMPANAYAEQWDTKGLHEEAIRVLGSTCRSSTGPRKKASTTRRSASG